MAQHSVLGASSAHRWIHCPGSVKATADMPDTTSSYAEEGSQAHALCEFRLLKALGRTAKKPGHKYDKDTETIAKDYAAYVMTQVTESSTVLVEQRVDYSEYVGTGAFGTADCLIIHDGTMHIVDYKHGQGVPVSAEDNDQLELYALGAFSLFQDLYEINNFRLTIFQPRIDNINTWEISLSDLLQKAEKVFRPKALEALGDNASFACGDWCRFCKLAGSCRVRAEENLKAARADFSLEPGNDAAQLSDDEMSQLLGRIDDIVSWATSVKDYALAQAKSGHKYPGWKLVHGRSVRKYLDEDKVAEVVKAKGFDPFEHKVLGVTAMEKMLGKKQFSTLLKDLVHKPLGKETLVPESDPRQAIAEDEDFSKLD